MDIREKLVELLREAPYNIFGNKLGNRCFDSCLEMIADHLITNCVTVQEWISVDDRLTEQDKEVLLIVYGWEDRLYYTGCLHRQEAERSWLTGIESKASDWKIWGFSYLREPIVTHWMPLPEPPKGE